MEDWKLNIERFLTYFDEKCTLWLFNLYIRFGTWAERRMNILGIEQMLGSQDVFHRFMFCFV